MPATWIADALRAGGCAVDETVVPDWKTRSHTDGPRMDTVVGVVGHHTAGGASGNLPSLATVRDGRSDLAGPLANLMLSRAGVWVPISAGRAWHAGAADRPAAWPWVPNGDANGYCLGIEAESAGTGDWTAAQLTAYPQGVAALLKYRGLPASRFIGHKEWAPSRKPDPHGWPGDMGGFRATVTNLLNGVTDMPLTPADAALVVNTLLDTQIGRGGNSQAGSTTLRATLAWSDQHVDDVRHDVAGVLAKIAAVSTSAPVNVDAVAVANALASSDTAIDKLADAIAAKIATRLGNG